MIDLTPSERRCARALDMIDGRANGHGARELRRFETRLPHGMAREIGRGRADRSYDFEIAMHDGLPAG